MFNDYRNTRYCPKLENISDKKAKVGEKVRAKHPRITDIYKYISQNNGPFKLEFINAYNGKCGYCGVSIKILPKEMFEIDHFICKKSFTDKAAAGFVENLVLACHSCNRQKSDLLISDLNRKYLYPDAEDIQKTFIRDDKYYIRVSDECKENEEITNFYNQLNLVGEIHRLDYLLMNMIGLQEKIKDKPEVSSKIGEAIEKLRFKRNTM